MHRQAVHPEKLQLEYTTAIVSRVDLFLFFCQKTLLNVPVGMYSWIPYTRFVCYVLPASRRRLQMLGQRCQTIYLSQKLRRGRIFSKLILKRNLLVFCDFLFPDDDVTGFPHERNREHTTSVLVTKFHVWPYLFWADAQLTSTICPSRQRSAKASKSKSFISCRVALSNKPKKNTQLGEA